MTVLGGLESFPYSSVYNHFKQNLFFADLMQQLKKKNPDQVSFQVVKYI